MQGEIERFNSWRKAMLILPLNFKTRLQCSLITCGFNRRNIEFVFTFNNNKKAITGRRKCLMFLHCITVLVLGFLKFERETHTYLALFLLFLVFMLSFYLFLDYDVINVRHPYKCPSTPMMSSSGDDITLRGIMTS